MHCGPKGGGVIHHRLSCGRLDQPIESEPVVHEASCICRRFVGAGWRDFHAAVKFCQDDACSVC